MILQDLVRRYIASDPNSPEGIRARMELLQKMFETAQGDDSDLARAVIHYYYVDLNWSEVNFTTQEGWDKSDRDREESFQRLIDLVS